MRCVDANGLMWATKPKEVQTQEANNHRRVKEEEMYGNTGSKFSRGNGKCREIHCKKAHQLLYNTTYNTK